ncbi:MAG: hypothetical protein ABIT71_25485, partial [Vicinamibacteraceae bacterium]
RHRDGSAMPPEIGDRPMITTAHFSGLSPAPWSGPKGWDAALTVYDDAGYGEEDEDDEEDEDEEDEDEQADGDDGATTGGKRS